MHLESLAVWLACCLVYTSAFDGDGDYWEYLLLEKRCLKQSQIANGPPVEAAAPDQPHNQQSKQTG